MPSRFGKTCLSSQQTGTQAELDKCEKKLSNASFVANAPAEVVEQEKQRIAAFKAELAQFEEQARRVATLR